MLYNKYVKYPKVKLDNREWPDKQIEKAPIWCSVDLRDGNQALPKPMNVDEKIKMFKMLVDIGFKEIEIGFPSASETEYEFTRKLIEDKLIPEDVTIQVLTQAREHLVKKTFEALKGVKTAIVHVYNSTSELQRRVVFKKDKDEVKSLAIKGAQMVKKYSEYTEYSESKFVFEYSPESFTGTELDYALEVCEAVLNVWKPSKENKAIINLPSTVEMATPNIYADQIEWFCKKLLNRESVILSLHTHNDRGTCTASSELGILAGADRVEGTLFGNGERTGNLDIMNMALNMYSQGVDPELEFSNLNDIVEAYEECTKMVVHERHPYAGKLVFTAFSGSHQDAIRKGLKSLKEGKNKHWEVPYLAVDPHDLGREYEEIIRINSQSGKGGTAYIMESDFGFILPKAMHPEFGKVIKKKSDELDCELSPEQIFKFFKEEYLENRSPYYLKNYKIHSIQNIEEEKNTVDIEAVISVNGKDTSIEGVGNGPVDAFFNAMNNKKYNGCKFISYDEHALNIGSHSKAVAYVQIESQDKKYFGVGISDNIDTASINAIVSALNRSKLK
ncbi:MULTISPECIES: 2-isopropylmalate synthase [Clostridium]|uniref:2-isopropylmalate synthase n=1 Tax=Clostridium acetobutylicum (strain ATCC 824 / DSM 792 / JCM 1419 / IAM 19013 / LMG 5710 / NBRC 13948 / NRRL B-527 / VKM B-1787 / 2291 / W) TaxID=272562 RepID=LEU1_CLOAB|nr:MULTISPECIES: 2-isopropylmalate synthase [Clostridium]Q97MC5.1 RecName: Full=2-isopropylmalate synthase; AltName: Full=Alpha-IPM synthase; AltName: Full=Alpha-isopropylmalate synthase [Clostridium acetobutylicum ATCC 824]AAK78254.1 2-isopropylmalate synthase [Clostridium acetobutylicum ATCC 824]ADZ19320.1 2-isopropylmalate synthase [Clostridium acetobutylicum EA 2018]AEI34520.1 2-isopropylmalate synthase [Clostridium acetobutylicum DSM 1731]AWV82061.1 2-isopropylmalate synthase [Clostridium